MIQTRQHYFDLQDWIATHSLFLLRASLGLVFLGFGALKFLPGVSPAEELAGKTIQALSFGLMTPHYSLPLLALIEVTIGIGLLSGRFTRATVALLMFQMAGTFTPFILFPSETMSGFCVPTMTGQYILKNIVFIVIGFVLLAADGSREHRRKN